MLPMLRTLRIVPLFLFLVRMPLLDAAAAPPSDYRFQVEILAEGMPQPMQLEIAPDGRVFFIEIAGKLRIYKPGERTIVEAGKLEVTTAQENGLLGMALDPQFSSNHLIYLLHSAKEFSGQTLSRFEMKGDLLDLASRTDLLSYEEQWPAIQHLDSLFTTV
jgi:cytochrome c